MAVNGIATLVVDLGNSDTRVITYFGRTQKGNRRKTVNTLSNMFGMFTDDQTFANVMKNSEYSEENSRVFTLDGDRYCTGLMQKSEFSSTALRPSGAAKKFETLESRLALCNAFCQGYENIARWTQSDLKSIDVDWDVTVLLPADDLDIGGRKISNMVKEINYLDFEMPEMHKEIRVRRVNVYPEGYCAFLGTVMERSGVIRKGYEKVFDEDALTLIIDIGAGTSDLSVVSSGKLITNSKYTEPIGGNNIESKFKQILKHNGYPRVGMSAISKACETGQLKQGTRVLDVHKELNSAKKSVAAELTQMIKDYQDLVEINLADVSYLLVVGGGSINNENDPNMEPITNHLVQFLRGEVSTGIELLELPLVQNSFTGEMERVSPRMLNVIGAGFASESFME